MVQLDLGNYQQALEALERVGRDKNSRALCEQFRGDALHNLGRLEEARAAYATSVELTSNDPVLSSKLGYTEVRLGTNQSRHHPAAQGGTSRPRIGGDPRTADESLHGSKQPA